MGNDIFKAGVQPGSPDSADEIKALICYLLSNIQEPMSFAQLHEVLDEKGLVNYFELVGAVESLLGSGHMKAVEKGAVERYIVTETGKRIAEALESALRPAVREKAVRSAELLLNRRRRLSEVSIEVRPADGGYQIELSIPEPEGVLAAFSLFVPTKEDCEHIRRRFLNDPVFIYKGVLALLTGNEDVLEGIFPQKEQLF